MIQFPICPPEAFSWWVAKCFCSYVFVQYSSLVFIETPSYGYIHLNFRLSVDFILHESHTEMGIALSCEHLASEERCFKICISNIIFHFIGGKDDQRSLLWDLKVVG